MSETLEQKDDGAVGKTAGFTAVLAAGGLLLVLASGRWGRTHGSTRSVRLQFEVRRAQAAQDAALQGRVSEVSERERTREPNGGR